MNSEQKAQAKQQWSIFLNQLKAAGEAVGKVGLDASDEVAEFAADRAEHLLQFKPDDPGYLTLVATEVTNVGMKIGLKSADVGDATDAQFNNVLQGALAFGSNVLRLAI